MLQSELNELQEELKQIDRHDQEAVKAWFQKYSYLTVHQQAAIWNVGLIKLRKCRRIAGIHHRKTIDPPRPISLPEGIAIKVPEIWKTKEWLEQVSQHYGLLTIAKAVKRDRAVVKAALARFNLPIPKDGRKSRNRCQTYEWCYYHYVTIGLSQTACAHLAGIARQTFITWLVKFRIDVRTRSGATVRTAWELKLIKDLKTQPDIIQDIWFTTKGILVRYPRRYETYSCVLKKPRLCDSLRHFKITINDTRLEKVPAIYPEFGYEIDGSIRYPAHVTISRREFNQSSFIEQRLALNRYGRQLIDRGWIWPEAPESILRSQFEVLRTKSAKGKITDGGLNTENVHPLVGHLMMHFFDFKYFYKLYSDNDRAVNIITSFCRYRKRTDLTFCNLMRAIWTGNCIERQRRFYVYRRKRIIHPSVYITIFRRLGLKGSILDLSLGFGSVALASAILGLDYVSSDPEFQFPLEKGFVEFANLRYTPYTGQNVDTIFYAEGSSGVPEMEKLTPLLSKAKRVLVYCPGFWKDEMLAYKPKKALKIFATMSRENPDYIFIW